MQTTIPFIRPSEIYRNGYRNGVPTYALRQVTAERITGRPYSKEDDQALIEAVTVFERQSIPVRVFVVGHDSIMAAGPTFKRRADGTPVEIYTVVGSPLEDECRREGFPAHVTDESLEWMLSFEDGRIFATFTDTVGISRRVELFENEGLIGDFDPVTGRHELPVIPLLNVIAFQATFRLMDRLDRSFRWKVR